MKKAIITSVVLIVAAALLASCAGGYDFKKSGVASVKGTSQMEESVKTVELTGKKADLLIKRLSKLKLRETGAENELKGWEYYFLITYSDGTETAVTLSSKQAVVDGFVCETDKYSPSDFEEFFK